MAANDHNSSTIRGRERKNAHMLPPNRNEMPPKKIIFKGPLKILYAIKSKGGGKGYNS